MMMTLAPVRVGFFVAGIALALGVTLPKPRSTSPQVMRRQLFDDPNSDLVYVAKGELTRGQIIWAMSKISPRVKSCYGKGLLDVEVTIAPNGRVESAVVRGNSNPCVEEAVRAARFPPSQTQTKLDYPFLLR
jgi:hypothetical protein